MTELSFANSFCISLESRPTRLSLEHVEDPRSHPAKGAYILPKMARPISKRQKLAPGQERSLVTRLRSLRNPPIDITLKSQSALTSVLDLKKEVSSRASIPLDKIRILYQKKPVGDSKVLKNLVLDDVSTVELGIMIMGGASSVTKDNATAVASAAQGTSEMDILATPDFWNDLKAFLIQRLKDQAEGERLLEVFRTAWFVSVAKVKLESH